MLREYIVSEAMAALGIPTTRALAVVSTGELVWRETALPGAVLTRVASSHIRVGTFQFFAARGDLDAIRCLADHVIARHYPEAVDAANRYRTLLDLVISRQAALIAQLSGQVWRKALRFSVPAAFALSRMRFWGSASIATGVFLTYLVPETLLFLPLFKMFAVFHEYTGIELINRWWVLLFIYPTLTVPFCTWVNCTHPYCGRTEDRLSGATEGSPVSSQMRVSRSYIKQLNNRMW